MVGALLFTLLAAAPVEPVSLSGGTDMVAWAVTIEGAAALEITADTCNTVYVIAKTAPTAEGALERLKAARKMFESAVRTIIGANGDIEFAPPRIARHRREKRTVFEALQTATLSFTDFPKREDDLNEHLGKITAAVVVSGVTGEGFAEPDVSFEITNPRALEQRLAAMAIEDAEKRAKVISKLLNRNFGRVLSGSFPAGVTAEGAFFPFTDAATPVVTGKLKTTLTYTVKLAFELEI